jgi:hypothetical protein
VSLRTFVIAFLLCAASLGMAQSRNSFQPVTSLSDIFVTSAESGKTFTVSMGPNPTFVYLGDLYSVMDLFGFWSLANSLNLLADGPNQNGWGYHENSTDIAGWKNPNKSFAIHPNDSLNFGYSDLNVAAVDAFGFHIRVHGSFPDGTDTMHITNVVPEPKGIAGIAVAALMSIAAFRRRA